MPWMNDESGEPTVWIPDYNSDNPEPALSAAESARQAQIASMYQRGQGTGYSGYENKVIGSEIGQDPNSLWMKVDSSYVDGTGINWNPNLANAVKNATVKVGDQYYMPAQYEQAITSSSPYKEGQKHGFTDALSGWMDNGGLVNLASTLFLGGAVGGAFGGAEAGTGVGTGTGAGTGVGTGTVAGSMPQSYYSMLADSSNVGVPSAAAGTIGSNLSPATAAWMQSAGYTADQIASIGSQFGTNGVLNGLALDAGYNVADAFRPDSSFNPDAEAVGRSATTAPTGTAGLLQQLSSLSGLTTDQLTRLGGAGISSLASLYGASKLGQASMNAANRVATANQSATQLQSQMYQDQVARQEPFYQVGVNALGPYTTGIMGTPEDRAAGRAGSLVRPFDVNKDYAQSPWYQASLDKRLKDYTNKMGSMGLVDSGPTRRGILDIAGRAGQEDITNAYNRYNQDLATQRGALGNLAGFASPAAAAMGAAGSNYGTNVNNLGISTATNYGNADMTGAAARQSAYMGAGGAFANALSPNPLNAYLNKQLGIA